MSTTATRPRAAHFRIPDTHTPEPVADTSRRLRAFELERRTLKEQPSTPNTTRRVSALSLLIDDTRTELLAAVATNKDTWTADLVEHAATAAAAYADVIHNLDTARHTVTATGQTLAWLDDATNNVAPRRFNLNPPAQLDGTPWPTVIAALTNELGDTTRITPTTATVHHPTFSGSLRDTIATFPPLDMPAPITNTYEEHHRLLDQHHALGNTRRELEKTRATAEAQDRRELADSIANNTTDPDDRHVAALDTKVAALDSERATLTIAIRDTYSSLRRLLREHHDTWRTTITARHTNALDAYSTAVAALPDTRTAHHTAHQALAWLNDTTPTGLGQWTPRTPALLGQPADALIDKLRRDLTAQRQAVAHPTGGTAA